VDGVAHVHASFNNTIITITDRQGNALAWPQQAPPASAVPARARPLPPRWPQRRRCCGARVGMKNIEVLVKGRVRVVNPPCVPSTMPVQSYQYYRCDPIPHNGCRPQEASRLSRRLAVAKYTGSKCRHAVVKAASCFEGRKVLHQQVPVKRVRSRLASMARNAPVCRITHTVA